MSTHIKLQRKALAAVCALTVLFAASIPSAGRSEPRLPGEYDMHNLASVFNFNPGWHDYGPHEYVGSDLEFFTHTTPLRDYTTGRFIDAAGNDLPLFDQDGEPTQPILAEHDFAVMGSYQRGGYIFDITDPENIKFVSRVLCRQDRNDVGIKKFVDQEGKTKVVLALTQQSGRPCDNNAESGAALQVTSPAEVAGTYRGLQWEESAQIDGQTGDLAYVGTGCTPASYISADVRGKIAFADSKYGYSGDECPTYLYKQKLEFAERAGAVGFVQIDVDNYPDNSTVVVASGIPAVEIGRTDGRRIRDALLDGAAVNATLTEILSVNVTPTYGWGSGGVGVFDITDPYEWAPMYHVLTGWQGTHNFAFHPTKPYGYSANGALPGLINEIPIIDFTNLDNPQLLTGRALTEGGTHDIEFSPNGDRAYAASENNYRIYDTTDPANPTLVSRTPNVGTYAHGVFPTSDLELMITNNESLALGGFVGGVAMCPGEGLASYAIGGERERSPEGPLGYYAPEVVGPGLSGRPCTSHFGRFFPGTKIMSIGWYVAGVRIVDWSNPAQPKEVAAAMQYSSSAWAAKFYKGPYVYAGDMSRGFDAFRWNGPGIAPWLTNQP